jgi:hypothetical protein
MSDASQRVRETAERLFGPEIGCSDGGCIYGQHEGPHTNGGCACFRAAKRGPPGSSVALQSLAHLALQLAKESR